MSTTLTILCENTVEKVYPSGLLGEYGFACHIQHGERSILFDTGNGLTLKHNAALMGINLGNVDSVIISHGHYDHVGGLYRLLEHRSALTVYSHPDIFYPRYSDKLDTLRSIGMPWSREDLEEIGARFDLSSEPRQLAAGITLSGTIPRTCEVETGDATLLVEKQKGQCCSDPLTDDQSLFIETEKGLVILLGCAHAGLINITRHALNLTGAKKVYMVLGGTHLRFCSQKQLDATMDMLEELGVERIGTSHCTGLEGSEALSRRFGKKVFAASVGTELTL